MVPSLRPAGARRPGVVGDRAHAREEIGVAREVGGRGAGDEITERGRLDAERPAPAVVLGVRRTNRDTAYLRLRHRARPRSRDSKPRRRSQEPAPRGTTNMRGAAGAAGAKGGRGGRSGHVEISTASTTTRSNRRASPTRRRWKHPRLVQPDRSAGGRPSSSEEDGAVAEPGETLAALPRLRSPRRQLSSATDMRPVARASCAWSEGCPLARRAGEANEPGGRRVDDDARANGEIGPDAHELARFERRSSPGVSSSGSLATTTEG